MAVLGAPLGTRHDASVVDQDIDARVPLHELLDALADRVERRQIERHVRHDAAWSTSSNGLDGLVDRRPAATREHHGGVHVGERHRGLEPDAAIGARDDHHLVREVAALVAHAAVVVSLDRVH